MIDVNNNSEINSNTNSNIVNNIPCLNLSSNSQ